MPVTRTMSNWNAVYYYGSQEAEAAAREVDDALPPETYSPGQTSPTAIMKLRSAYFWFHQVVCTDMQTGPGRPGHRAAPLRP